ncbi:MAG: ATP-binding cassette domain-containing protein, partial [Candidatus Portnoybacteria bacterium]|nr:ATP-binding cassette domain-containing protein [Candidatus Portnoybacteria bacterium]
MNNQDDNKLNPGEGNLISVRNLSKTFALGKNIEAPALRGVSFDVARGDFLSITGHSGSGKTTLLNLIGILDEPSGGEILINNKNIHKLKEKEKVNFRLKFVSFVFQFYNLINNYTALDNIAFPLRLQGRGYRESRDKAREIINFLGLAERAD